MSPRRPTPARGLLLVVLVGLTATSLAIAPGAATTRTNGTLVVDGDADGDAGYAAIGAALDDAGDGDRVVVHPGTYREELTLDANVTLVAPRGATLDGSTVDALVAAGITVRGDAAPVVVGFTVTRYEVGLDARAADGPWTVRDVTFLDNRIAGIDAGVASGDWTVRNATVRGTADTGIVASNALGDWTVRDSAFRANGDRGIDASESAGDWTVRNGTFRANGGDAIDARRTDGDWRVEDVLAIDSSDEAVAAYRTAGNWTVRNLTVRGAGRPGRITVGAGVDAFRSTGAWTVRDTTVLNSNAGVVAPETRGDWTLRNVVVRNGTAVGVLATNASGDWTVHNGTFEATPAGVYAYGTSGAWTIVRSTIRNATGSPRVQFAGEGTAVYAANASGPWRIRRSTIVGSGRHGINATGARRRGDATRNWWGRPEGPTAGACVGNVTCAAPLAVPPGETSEPPRLAPDLAPPTDPDDDGRFEDVTGDGRFTVVDVSAFLRTFRAVPAEHTDSFDFDGDGLVGVVDVAALLGAL